MSDSGAEDVKPKTITTPKRKSSTRKTAVKEESTSASDEEEKPSVQATTPRQKAAAVKKAKLNDGDTAVKTEVATPAKKVRVLIGNLAQLIDVKLFSPMTIPHVRFYSAAASVALNHLYRPRLSAGIATQVGNKELGWERTRWQIKPGWTWRWTGRQGGDGWRRGLGFFRLIRRA